MSTTPGDGDGKYFRSPPSISMPIPVGCLLPSGNFLPFCMVGVFSVSAGYPGGYAGSAGYPSCPEIQFHGQKAVGYHRRPAIMSSRLREIRDESPPCRSRSMSALRRSVNVGSTDDEEEPCPRQAGGESPNLSSTREKISGKKI